MTTSPPHSLTRHPRGMTVIELLVVIAVVAGLLSASIYAVGALTATDLKDEAMRMTSAMKYTWTRAAVNGAQYRMVIDLDEGSYHTEVTEAGVVREPEDERSHEGRLPEEIQEEEDRRNPGTSSLFDDDEERDPFGVHRAPTFQQVQDGALEAHAFKSGVSVHEIHVTHQEAPITAGKVAINFFPDGFQQPVIIVLENERGDYYSLVNEPLTGRVFLYSEKIDDRDRLREGEELD